LYSVEVIILIKGEVVAKNRLISILLFLLLLLIILCVWCHSEEIAKKRAEAVSAFQTDKIDTPIQFRIQKENELFNVLGNLNNKEDADKLVKSLEKENYNNKVSLSSKVKKDDELLQFTTKLTKTFKESYLNGFIDYKNNTFTIKGVVETQEEKDRLENLLKNSSYKYNNLTEIIPSVPSKEELERLAEAEEEAKRVQQEREQKRLAEEEAKKAELAREHKRLAEEKAQKELALKLQAEEEALRLKAIQEEKAKVIETKIKKVIDFEHINFELNKAVLTTQSYEALKKIALILQENPNVNIEIGGHTDDSGDDAHNLTLSQNRVDTVKKALINLGSEEERLKAVGYGETKPLVSNDTQENRRKNRRVEFKVLGE